MTTDIQSREICLIRYLTNKKRQSKTVNLYTISGINYALKRLKLLLCTYMEKRRKSMELRIQIYPGS